MITCEEFEEELQEALAHLYHPDYQPSETLCALTGCDVRNGALAVQSAIIRVIETLKPPPNTPQGARPRLVYDLLYNRFVLKLTQEETAERLHLSVSSTRRSQAEAMHALARLLWEHHRARQASQDDMTPRHGQQRLGGVASDLQTLDWRSQLRTDLAYLQRNAPDAVANVGEAIFSVVQLERHLMSQRGISLKVGDVQPGLIAAIHPAVLRQVLIMVVGQLVQDASCGAITVIAGTEGEKITVTVEGPSPAGDTLPNCDLLREILALQGGSLEVGRGPDSLSFRVEVPTAGNVTVLVVEDNPDMIYFYRRCAEGTRYRIVHEGLGQHALESVAAYAPDVIVLDIMLPDANGWELLLDLSHHSASRSIPVIACSVIREKHLALALGAALVLHKPVNHQDFIQALDQVVGQVSITASGVQASNAATD